MDARSTILVTGATGFIGTRLVQALVEKGHSVRALSRHKNPQPPPGFELPGGSPFNHPNVQLVLGDVTDRDSVRRAMEGSDYVFHLAAYAKNWAANPRTYFDVNVGGMKNVFDAAKELGVQRIVWTSTIVTFGPTQPHEVGDEKMSRITPECLTEYEASKVEAERVAFEYIKNGLPVVIVNPARVYGPGHLTEGNSLSQLIDAYDRGKAPVMLNRGVNVGNYVLVDDVVEGHILAMERGRIGEKYILGGENASLRELFDTIDVVSGKRHFRIPLLKYGPLIFSYVQELKAKWFGVYPTITPGWVRTFLVDWAYSCQKAERELGYRPTPLADGIRITYDWLLRLRPVRRERRGILLRIRRIFAWLLRLRRERV